MLSRVSRLARHLDRARRAAFAEHDLETWEFDVLTALRRAGEPYEMSPGALLRATLVTSGTMTNRIDRLAAAGLVRRRPDPEDRRGVLVSLTEPGGTVDDAFADLLRRERDLLAGLREREQQAGLLRTLLVPFDATDTGDRTRARPGSTHGRPRASGPPARPPRPAPPSARVELDQPLVVGGVPGQRRVQLRLPAVTLVELAFQPGELLLRGPLPGAARGAAAGRGRGEPPGPAAAAAAARRSRYSFTPPGRIQPGRRAARPRGR